MSTPAPKILVFSQGEAYPAITLRARADRRFPRPGKQLVTLRLDRDVLDWFRKAGKGYQTRINAVLRAYKNAHSRAE
jgi:uncharacterized protein (DUF4415 family)